MAKTEVKGNNIGVDANGQVYGATLVVDYDTRLFAEGPKAKVRGLKINLTGMLLTKLITAAWGHLKVQRQQAERGCDDIGTIEAYSGQEISWAMIGRKLISMEELAQSARSAVAAMDEINRLRLAVETMQGIGLDTTEIELKIVELEEAQSVVEEKDLFEDEV